MIQRHPRRGICGWLARLLRRLAHWIEGSPNTWTLNVSHLSGSITSSTEKI